MANLRICSLNARGLQNKLKRVTLFSQLKKQKYDIICLQETHVTEKDTKLWEKQWGGKCFFNLGTNKSRGEVILISKHLTAEMQLVDKKERITVVEIKNDHYDFYLINIYAPNSLRDKRIFFNELKELVNSYEDKDILIVGDFNSVLDNKRDILSGHPHQETEVKMFNETIQSLGLRDTWRHFHEDEKDYTWGRFNPFIARRLDYAFMSDNL